ncbi:ribosomal protein S18-alanine N-acetyltransferase [Tuanshanicoccus lijuaniae]|uniref:ribosomal protein S18-alanine N-acetyltransferase n=1 Tax=Aerococcaceae bacterium zg-1292 TaxID=2774330 RepID=UPI001BD8480D|nr:ribosomal protein S18-alanine N-acetyltransferase [Aerococcaceae bacterium zg-A91]MBS4458389.1 ribosomal protein S18-alanine N-acetyltransferase [Aerococcaceae bacterium zg-BR33]
MMKWFKQQFNKWRHWLIPAPPTLDKAPFLMEELAMAPSALADEMVMRFAAGEDIQSFEQLETACYDGYLAWQHHDFVHDWLHNPYAVYIVVEHQQRIVALISGRMRHRNAHISHVMVLPDYQGKGLGKQMVQQWQALVIQRNIECVTLEVRESNQAAQHLYQSLGFTVIDRRENYYFNNHETALIMSWRNRQMTQSA